jgi:hypothetical protein
MARPGDHDVARNAWRGGFLMTARIWSKARSVSGASLLVAAALLFSAQLALAQFTQQGPKLVGTSDSEITASQGYAVALSADGNTAIVGGPRDGRATRGGPLGAAWIFTRSGGVWTQQGPKLVGTDNVDSGQGWSVALSADGNTAIVGGYWDNDTAGAVWVFTRSGGVWTQQGPKLVGTGAVGTARQGWSVALSGDGNTAIVGGPYDDLSKGYRGAAWVFTRSGGMWTQQGPKLVGTGAIEGTTPGVERGYSVALSADGNTAVVGGPGDNASLGATWVFTRSAGVWTQQAKLAGTGAGAGTGQGWSVSLAADGNTAIVGGPYPFDTTGAAWVFTRSGAVWTQQGPKLVGSGSVTVNGSPAQGWSVSLSGDGNTAMVGGWRDNNGVGAAWVFTRSNGVWSQLGGKLVGTGAASPAEQAWSVALSADGTTAMIGGPSDSPGRLSVGAAWVFVYTPPPPPPPPPPAPVCTLASQLGDLNGDGRDDIVFRRKTDGLLSDYLMNGFQIVSAQVIGTVGTDFTLTAVADFNGDGMADLLFRRLSDGQMVMYLMNGPQVVSAQVVGNLGTDWEFAGAGDFNGDGRSDIVFRRKSDGMIALYLMNGSQVLAAQWLGALGIDWRVRGVRDFNGDGRADVLFRRTGDGMLALYEFNGFQLVAAQLLGAVGMDFEVAGARDFNGDGRADILFRRASDGMLAIYLMNGFQVVAAQLIGAVGTDIAVLGLGDFNGDGRADILFRRTSDGLLAMYLMNGFQVVAAQSLGAVGMEFTACYGQPPYSPMQVSQR